MESQTGRSLPERSCKVTESLQDEVGGQRTPVSSRKGPTLPGTLLCPPGRSLPEYPCHTQPVTERNHGRQGPSTNAAKISKRDSWVLRQVDSLHYPPVEICATDHQRGKGVSTLGKTFPDQNLLKPSITNNLTSHYYRIRRGKEKDKKSKGKCYLNIYHKPTQFSNL